MDTLHKRLRCTRRGQDLTQEQLAKLAGVDRATISRIETGESRQVRSDTLIGLAKALKVSPEFLLLGDVVEHAH